MFPWHHSSCDPSCWGEHSRKHSGAEVQPATRYCFSVDKHWVHRACAIFFLYTAAGIAPNLNLTGKLEYPQQLDSNFPVTITYGIPDDSMHTGARCLHLWHSTCGLHCATLMSSAHPTLAPLCQQLLIMNIRNVIGGQAHLPTAASTHSALSISHHYSGCGAHHFQQSVRVIAPVHEMLCMLYRAVTHVLLYIHCAVTCIC